MPGVFADPVGPVALGLLMNKGLTQTHFVRSLQLLLDRTQNGEIDPSFIISHRTASLEDGPGLHEAFRDKKHGCTKVVIKPHG